MRKHDLLSQSDGSVPSQRGARFYRPELDAVRFFAFLAVFCTHAIPRNPGRISRDPTSSIAILIAAASRAGALGVCLFFTLSAYLICELLLREREQTGTVHVVAFYKRRMLRVWPLYFFALGMGCVFSIARHQSSQLTRFLAYALMLGNWYEMFFGARENPLNILWSLSVEEQFYLFCPWLLKLLSRKLLILFSFALIVGANCALIRVAGSGWEKIWRNSFVQFEMFAAGMLLALLLDGSVPAIPTWLRLLFLGFGPTSWFLAVYELHLGEAINHPPATRFELMAGFALTACGAIALLFGALGSPSTWFPRWMTTLGKISFGLYVYHEIALSLLNEVDQGHLGIPVLLLRRVAALLLTIFLAGISYRFLERPFLLRKRAIELIPSRPI